MTVGLILLLTSDPGSPAGQARPRFKSRSKHAIQSITRRIMTTCWCAPLLFAPFPPRRSQDLVFIPIPAASRLESDRRLGAQLALQLVLAPLYEEVK